MIPTLFALEDGLRKLEPLLNVTIEHPEKLCNQLQSQVDLVTFFNQRLASVTLLQARVERFSENVCYIQDIEGDYRDQTD